MKCNIVVNVDYAKIIIDNKSDWCTAPESLFVDANSTVTIPLVFLDGADETCVATSVGTVAGGALVIDVGTDNVRVTLTNAKVRVGVNNNDSEAISQIIPAQQFASIGSNAVFTVEYNTGYSASGTKSDIGTLSGTTLSVPVTSGSSRIDATVVPNIHTVTIVNNVPYVVMEYGTVSVRHGGTINCNIVYGESSDYTCISTNYGVISAANGLTVGTINNDMTVNITPRKVQVKATNHAPYHVTGIAPAAQYVTAGQNAIITMVYLDGYDHSDLTASIGTISNNKLTVPTSSSNYFVNATVFRTAETQIAIGEDSSNTNYNLPLNMYSPYSLSQQIYSSSEIGESGTIAKISFYVDTNTTTDQTRKIDVYMENVELTTSPQWQKITSNSTKVFSGSVVFKGRQWTTITLSTPFAFDNTKNLLLTVYDYSASKSSSTRYFKTYSTTPSIYSSQRSSYNVNSISGYGNTAICRNSIKLSMLREIEDTPESIEPVVEPTFIEIGSMESGTTVSSVAMYTTLQTPLTSRYKYSLSEQIYLPSEIGQSGKITDIGFHYADDTEMIRSFDLYLAHTDRIKFTPDAISGTKSYDRIILPSTGTLVYSGSKLFTKGWVNIHLSTPFVYDGEHNLCVILYDNTGTAESAAYMFTVNEGDTNVRRMMGAAQGSALDLTNSTLGSSRKDACNYRNVIHLAFE